jgi:hypothetical protein
MTVSTNYTAVNVGSTPNDGTGDDLRTAFDKVNQNFANIYQQGAEVADWTVEGTVNAGFLVGDGSGLTNLPTQYSNVIVSNFLSTYSGNVASLNVTGNLIATSFEVNGNIYLSDDYVPAAANSSGVSGQIAYDSSYVYICVDADSWKRANLVAW